MLVIKLKNIMQLLKKIVDFNGFWWLVVCSVVLRCIFGGRVTHKSGGDIWAISGEECIID